MCGRGLIVALLLAAASAPDASAAPADSAVPAQEGPVFDEYPIVVPKRAALVLDRLLVALQNALREDKAEAGWGGAGAPVELRGEEERVNAPAALRVRTPPYDDYAQQQLPEDTGRTMDLQRRGHGGGGRGRVLRCYFNAVTCFRK